MRDSLLLPNVVCSVVVGFIPALKSGAFSSNIRNQRTLELFGIDSVEAFLEYTPWDFAPGEQPEGANSKTLAQEQITTAFETGEAFFEFTHQRADGSEFPSEVKLSKFQVDGEPAVHALVRDITERKRYQAQLQTQRDNLEILNQIVRHDIRNELQTILGYADVLEAEATGTDAEHVQQVLSSARHATDITETARDVSEILLQADVDLKPVSFTHVLEDAVTNTQMSREKAVVGIEGTIPNVTVIANELLGSVFRNLLSNAVDHNDKAVPKVRISADIRDNDVLVRIADNGPGIPEERTEIIFEEGEHGIESDGTGLGLYLVQTLVSQYGGEVWVENRTDEDSQPTGAAFMVTVPLAE